MNNMCKNCACLNVDCKGSQELAWTGCIYKKSIPMITINKTTDYFKITTEEASKIINEYGYTREEAKVLDAGLEHHFFETLKGLMEEYTSSTRKAYTDKNEYDVTLFQFVADNDNHNKYCMVFA